MTSEIHNATRARCSLISAETLKAGRHLRHDFYYSGNPLETGRFGGIAFKKDPAAGHGSTPRAKERAQASGGRTRTVADEVESMKISVCDILTTCRRVERKVSGQDDLGDGYTRWDCWSNTASTTTTSA